MQLEEIYSIYKANPNIQTDTRKLTVGDLYVALKGANFNGNDFVKNAFELGASYCIVDEKIAVINDRCILVDDTLQTLQRLAAYHRDQLAIPWIAITGSNGKTTTKELMKAVLSSQYRTYATEGNLNNHIGVPLTVLKVKPDAEMVIIEMGANHQQEIALYCTIAKPTHALINNCGKAHLEGFGGIQGVRKGKGELYDFIRQNGGLIFRNADLDYLETMSAGISLQYTYGTINANIIGKSWIENSMLQVAILQPQAECLIRTHLVGEYNTANVLGAFAVGYFFKIPVQQIKSAIEAYIPSNSRSQLITKGTNTYILDAYNANPTSMKMAIENFMQTDFPNKIVILGAMMELGEDSIAEHQQLIALLETSHWNAVVLVGGDFKFVKHSFIYIENSDLASNWMREKAFEHAAFLIKGSRAFQMEKILRD